MIIPRILHTAILGLGQWGVKVGPNIMGLVMWVEKVSKKGGESNDSEHE